MLIQAEQKPEKQRGKDSKQSLKLQLKPKETNLAQQQAKLLQRLPWTKAEIQRTFFYLIATEKSVSPGMTQVVSICFAIYL